MNSLLPLELNPHRFGLMLTKNVDVDAFICVFSRHLQMIMQASVTVILKRRLQLRVSSTSYLIDYLCVQRSREYMQYNLELKMNGWRHNTDN